MRALGPADTWGTWGWHRRPAVNLLLESRARDSNTDLLGELPGVGETTRGLKLWTPKPREGRAVCLLGPWEGVGPTTTPLSEFPHPGSFSCSRKKQGCGP